MNILITGARGFVGKNLTEALKAIRDGKDRTHPELEIRDICGYDTDNTPEQLADFCKTADFVFHLAGVNRPKTAEEYLPGNTGVRIEDLALVTETGVEILNAYPHDPVRLD